MRGEQPTVPIIIDSSPVLVPIKKTPWVTANIIDPKDGTVHYHVVSTKALNIAVASIVTLMVCGLLVLGLVIYLKIDVDNNRVQIEQIMKEVPDNADTQEPGPK